MTKAVIDALCARSGRLHEFCHEGLRGIATVNRIELTPQPDANRGPGLSLSYQGWSPSLHEAWTVAYEPLPEVDCDEDEATDAMIAHFGKVIRRQRLRARDAEALGHVAPLAKGTVRHLQIDRAIASIYLAGGEHRELEEFARSTIGAIHNGAIQNAGGATLGRDGQMVGEIIRPDDTVIRYVAPKVKIYGKPGRKPAVFTGHQLRLHVDRLPETVLAATVGKPLSTLVEIHPELDGRIIRKAENDERGAAKTILIGLDSYLDPITASS